MTSQPARMANRAAKQATEKGSGMGLRFTFQQTLLFAFAAFAAANSLLANDSIDWQSDINKAKHEAAAQKKLVLLHFTASWCSACKEIDRFVFANPMTIRTMEEQVIPVRVDIDLHSHVAQEFGVSTVPYDVLITSAGNIIKERPSPRSSDGYRELITQAKQSAATVPKKVVKEINELRQEARRQRQLRATQNAVSDSNRSDITPVALQDRLRADHSTADIENYEPWSTTDTQNTAQPKLLHMTETSPTGLPGGEPEPSSNNTVTGSQQTAPPQGSMKKPKPRVSYGSVPAEKSTATTSTQNKFQAQIPSRSQTVQTQEPLATRIVNPLYQRKQADIAAQVSWKHENSTESKTVKTSRENPTPPRENTTGLIPETVEKPLGFSFNNAEPTLAVPYRPAPPKTPVAADELKTNHTQSASEKPPEAPKRTLSEPAKILPKAAEFRWEEPRGGSFKPPNPSATAATDPLQTQPTTSEIKTETVASQTDSESRVDPLDEPEPIPPPTNPIDDSTQDTDATKMPRESILTPEDVDQGTDRPIEGSSEAEVSAPKIKPEGSGNLGLAAPSTPAGETVEAKTPAAFQQDLAMEQGMTEVAAQPPKISDSLTNPNPDTDTAVTTDTQATNSPESVPTILKPRPITKAKPAKAKPESNVGLEGYCCVSLMEDQKWIKGSETWGCFHRGRLFLFASEKYRDLFQTNPDIYSPLLGGADPVRFHENGDLVDGKRKHGVFYGDEGGPTVIVLFSTAETRAKFEKDPTEYLRSVRQAMNRLDSDLLIR